MDKLILRPKNYSGNLQVISVRLPDETIKKLEEIAAELDKSRSEIAKEMILFALDNFEIEKP